MDLRPLGRTGLSVSALGFGCGNVGGLMIRGAAAERERAITRAMELGVNYFDTAALYGDGQSETNLGLALKNLGVRGRVYVGTKFRLAPEDLTSVPAAIDRALDGSLRRLGMDSVDLFQFHNPLGPARDGSKASVRDVLDAIVPALQRLQQAGKIRFYGITALGDTDALHQVIGSGAVHTMQTVLNLLNPSGAHAVPAGFPAQDFRGLLRTARTHGTGAIVIRVAAAGALSGTMERHPVAVPTVDPIASGADYATDVKRSAAFAALVKDGYAGSLVEASMRFAIGAEGVSTVLLGYSSLEHLEAAAAAADRGPLPHAALDRLDAIWKDLAHRH
ncbi:MAG: aldo/keto reductase [Candidatus Rokubacteria bacterium]|nr:aldo/keto reductase [Candidatus Rokubacteria bacterium]